MRSHGLRKAKLKLRRVRGLRFAAFCSALALMAAFLAVWFNVRVRPLMVELIASKINNYGLQYISEAVNEELESGLEYTNIVTLVKDDAGSVRAMVTDMAKINALQASLALKMLEKSDIDEEITVDVPIGTILGINISSGRGFEIPLKAVLGSDAEVNLISSLSSAGINQTCHRIIAECTVAYKVFVPGEWVLSEAVSRVVVAETVIVGEVPESYTLFQNDYTSDDGALTEYYLTQ